MFQKKLILLSMLGISLVANAQNRVVAQVSNFRNDQGVCRACIFDKASGLEQMKPLQCVQSMISGSSSQVVFNNIADGTYAIFLFHDKNNNGKMDTNFLGIPKEGYGASGNNLPFAAAPKFDANKFTLSGQHTLNLSIRLRNF